MVSRRREGKIRRATLQGEVGTSDATLGPRFNPRSRSAIVAERRAGEKVCWRKVWQEGRLANGQVGVAG